MKYPEVRNYRDGSFVDGDRAYIDVYNPSDGSVISRVPMSTREDVDAAVSSAERAFPGWSRTPIKERVQVFYKYKALLEQHIDELAALVSGGERKGHERSAGRGAEGGGALRVRVLAAADRAGRSARGESRGRVPDRAVPVRRRGGDHAVQLPEHGAELVPA